MQAFYCCLRMRLYWDGGASCLVATSLFSIQRIGATATSLTMNAVRTREYLVMYAPWIYLNSYF